MKKWYFPALVLLLFVTSCTKPKDLEYVDFQNIRLIKFGLQESTVGVDIRFFNPNRQKVFMKEAKVDVYINNEFLGKTTLDSTITIPKRDTFTIPLTVKVQTLSAANSLFQQLSDSTVLVRFNGNAKLGKGGVFLNYPINYEGTQSVKF